MTDVAGTHPGCKFDVFPRNYPIPHGEFIDKLSTMPQRNSPRRERYLAATASISTSAPMGRAATSKHTRAGMSAVKNSA